MADVEQAGGITFGHSLGVPFHFHTLDAIAWMKLLLRIEHAASYN